MIDAFPSALFDVLARVGAIAIVVAAVFALGALTALLERRSAQEVAGFVPASTLPGGRHPATPSLFSTHQIRTETCNPAGEISIVCFCGEPFRGLADRDEAKRAMCFHQAEQEAQETGKVVRFR